MATQFEKVLKDIEHLYQVQVKIRESSKNFAEDSKNVADRYQKLHDTTKSTSDFIGKFLPRSLISGLDKVSADTQEIVKLISRRAEISQVIDDLVTKEIEQSEKLAGFHRDIGSMSKQALKMKRSEKILVDDLEKTYQEVLDFRKNGQLKEAAEQLHYFEETRLQLGKIGQKLLTNKKNAMEVASQIVSTKDSIKNANEEFAKATTTIAELKERSGKWAEALDDVKETVKKVGIQFALELAISKLVIDSFRDANKYLKDSSAILANRLRLYKTNLAVSFDLATSTARTAEAQQAFLQYGIKSEANSAQHVKTAVMLADTFDLSLDAIAKLSLQSSVLGANFDRVADAITVMTDNFNLSAQESAKIASDMADINIGLGNKGVDLSKLDATVGAYAGLFKSLGAKSGDTEELLKSFSSVQGIGNARMFGGSNGVLSKGDFGSPEAQAKSLENTAKMLAVRTQGGQNPLLVQQAATQLGIDKTTVEAYVRALNEGKFKDLAKSIQDSNKEIDKNNALQSQYQSQLSILGGAWITFKNRGEAILKYFLTPFVSVIAGLLTHVNSALSSLGDFAIKIKTSTGIFADSMKFVAKTIAWVTSAALMLALVLALKTVGKGFLKVAADVGAGSLIKKSILSPFNFAWSMLKSGSEIVFKFGNKMKFLIGALRGGLAAFASSGSILSTILTKIFLPLAALYGSFKIGQLGTILYKLHQDRKYEASSGLEADAAEKRLKLKREQLGIPAGMTAGDWNIQRQKISQSSSLDTQSVTSGQAVQKQIQSRQLEALDLLRKEVVNVKSEVKDGSVKQVKVAEKDIRISSQKDRLQLENMALWMSPRLTYGLGLD